jgi:hypothetical protein
MGLDDSHLPQGMPDLEQQSTSELRHHSKDHNSNALPPVEKMPATSSTKHGSLKAENGTPDLSGDDEPLPKLSDSASAIPLMESERRPSKGQSNPKNKRLVKRKSSMTVDRTGGPKVPASGGKLIGA